MKRIGLIAGWGDLPLIWAKQAKKKGIEIYVFKLAEEKTASFTELAEQVYQVNIGQLDHLIELILSHHIEETVMLGKVRKEHLFANLELDRRMQKVLAALPLLNDDSILLGIVDELAAAGIEVLPQSIFLDRLLPERGLIVGEITPQLQEDMAYAFRLAREMGRLDIGQTVLVKDRAALAVEAIEGTDAAIKRAGKYGGRGLVMAKVSKVKQDLRFDIPTVGLKTLDSLLAVGAKGLIIEAERTFLLKRDKFIERADAGGLTVIAASFSLEEEGGILWGE